NPQALDGLEDDRVQIVFSNYKNSLEPRQVELYERNLEMVKTMGLRVIAPHSTPTWSVPTTLSNKHYPLETMIEKRSACLAPLNCKYLKDGKFFPCTVTDSIYNLQVADYL